MCVSFLARIRTLVCELKPACRDNKTSSELYHRNCYATRTLGTYPSLLQLNGTHYRHGKPFPLTTGGLQWKRWCLFVAVLITYAMVYKTNLTLLVWSLSFNKHLQEPTYLTKYCVTYSLYSPFFQLLTDLNFDDGSVRDEESLKPYPIWSENQWICCSFRAIYTVQVLNLRVSKLSYRFDLIWYEWLLQFLYIITTKVLNVLVVVASQFLKL
jgi:hypothetical protein